MNNKIIIVMKKFTMIAIMMSIASFAMSQNFWTEIALPDSCNLVNIDGTSNGNLYAATNNGLYKSTDNGNEWSLTGMSVSCGNVYIDDNDVIYVNHGNQLLHSSDDALIWDTIQMPVTTGILYANDSVIIVGKINCPGIYTSHDYGDTWTFSMGPISGYAYKIYEFNGMLILCSFAFTDEGGFFLSHDYGMTWEPTSMNQIYFYGTGAASNSQGVIFLSSSDGVYKSDDNGQSWQIIVTLYPGIFIDIMITAEDDIYGAIDDEFNIEPYGVYRSSDNGDTWEHINSGMGDDININGLYQSSNGSIFAYRDRLFRHSSEMPGDANGDMKVDVNDIQRIISFMMSDIESIEFTNADVNNDGIINILDIVATVNLIFQ